MVGTDPEQLAMVVELKYLPQENGVAKKVDLSDDLLTNMLHHFLTLAGSERMEPFV